MSGSKKSGPSPLQHPFGDGGDAARRLLVAHPAVLQPRHGRDLPDLAQGAAAGLGIAGAGHGRATCGGGGGSRDRLLPVAQRWGGDREAVERRWGWGGCLGRTKYPLINCSLNG